MAFLFAPGQKRDSCPLLREEARGGFSDPTISARYDRYFLQQLA
jgi:hypothetical protein